MRAACLAAVLLPAALLLRWPIASHDLQHYIGPDEGEIVENVLEMIKTGDFDHRHPGYPGLHFYLQMVPASVRLAAEGRSVAELPREDFYLTARRTTLAAGVLAGALVLLAGRTFLSFFWAALAAGLMLASPLAFRESAVVNPDLMLSLFVGLSLLCSLRLLEERSLSRFLAAGLSVGLATAIKYTGAFTLAPYALAVFLAPVGRREARYAVLGCLAGAIGFALVSPYTLWNLEESLHGLQMHVSYYRASDRNAALELVKVLGTRGLGIVPAAAALLGAAHALWTREPKRLVVLSHPLFYLLAFSLFERAFPRHALPLLPSLALLAAGGGQWISARRLPGAGTCALALAIAAGPVLGSLHLRRRLALPTPAERSGRWASETLPAGSRVLLDQLTPRLDPSLFRLHRLRVEERVFVGDFDWVIHSGYPPGIETAGLREVVRFESDGALGSAVTVYQVPSRDSLMGVTLPDPASSVEIGAGELRYFGKGFDPPRPGPYGTERLSRGEASEIYFVLPPAVGPQELLLELELRPAAPDSFVGVELLLNEVPVGRFQVQGEEPEAAAADLPAEILRPGLNRLDLRYSATARLDRRHREAAVAVHSLRLTRSRNRNRPR